MHGVCVVMFGLAGKKIFVCVVWFFGRRRKWITRRLERSKSYLTFVYCLFVTVDNLRVLVEPLLPCMLYATGNVMSFFMMIECQGQAL